MKTSLLKVLVWVATTVGIIGGILLFILGAMWLWNWLAPIFGLPTLTYLQMTGVILICRLLFSTITYKSNE